MMPRQAGWSDGRQLAKNVDSISGDDGIEPSINLGFSSRSVKYSAHATPKNGPEF